MLLIVLMFAFTYARTNNLYFNHLYMFDTYAYNNDCNIHFKQYYI